MVAMSSGKREGRMSLLKKIALTASAAIVTAGLTSAAWAESAVNLAWKCR